MPAALRTEATRRSSRNLHLSVLAYLLPAFLHALNTLFTTADHLEPTVLVSLLVELGRLDRSPAPVVAHQALPLRVHHVLGCPLEAPLRVIGALGTAFGVRGLVAKPCSAQRRREYTGLHRRFRQRDGRCGDVG